MSDTPQSVTVLSGGVGGAKLGLGLARRRVEQQVDPVGGLRVLGRGATGEEEREKEQRVRARRVP